MSHPKRSGPKSNYELGPDGKPAVGFSKGKDGYYYTHWRAEGYEKRPHFGPPHDYDGAYHKYLKFMQDKEGENYTKVNKPYFLKSLKTHMEFKYDEDFLKKIQKGGIKNLKEIFDKLSVDSTYVPDSVCLERTRELLLDNQKETAKKMNLPGLANVNLFEQKESLTLKEVGDMYIQRKRKPLSPKVKSDARIWWEEFLEIVKCDRIREITVDKINHYQEVIYDKGEHMSPSFVNNRFDMIKTIVNNISKTIGDSEDQRVLQNHLKVLVLKEKAKYNSQPITKDEFRAILGACKNIKWRAILILATNTGFTPIDYTYLMKDDINLQDKTLIMYRQKTKIARVTMLTDRTIDALKKYIEIRDNDNSNYFFVNRYGLPYTANSIGKYWREKLLPNAKVSRRVCFEHIKDAVQSIPVNEYDCDPVEVRYLLGHKEKGVTDHYLKRLAKRTNKIVKCLDRYFFEEGDEG
ncbi:MAG: tyrosine-type recombinase/integrase [Planctomycetota bacterium]